MLKRYFIGINYIQINFSMSIRLLTPKLILKLDALGEFWRIISELKKVYPIFFLRAEQALQSLYTWKS